MLYRPRPRPSARRRGRGGFVYREGKGFPAEVYLRLPSQKTHVVLEDEDDHGGESMDIFSQLPVPVLHHILCFLSQKEAFRTRAISKSWRFHGPTRPKFDFRQSYFRDLSSFISIMETTIDRFLNRNLSLPEFHLEMAEPNYTSTAFLELWIPLIFDKLAVKTFELSFVYRKIPCFDLPQRLFVSDTLENLSLKNCSLGKNRVQKVKLNHVKSLSLNGVCIENESLEMLFSGCPLIEDLVLYRCPLQDTVVVDKCFKLKHFHFCDSVVDELVRERVESKGVIISGIQTIETLKIEGCSNWFHRHHREDADHSFPLVNSLHLDNVKLSPESLDCISYHFPALENLTLVNCYGCEEYQVSNRIIKHLRIESMKMFDKAAIDNGNHLFPLVESLCLVDVELTSELFKCLSCHFPSLEKLTLERCYGLDEYLVSSQSIKYLRIERLRMNYPVKVVVDAPNLEQFEYEGVIPNSFSFEKTSVDWTSKVVVLCEVDSKNDPLLWCLELYEGLKGFIGSRISLDITTHFRGHHKRGRERPSSQIAAQDTLEPIVLECMSIRLLRHSTSTSSAYINNMLCLFHPRNMTQFMYRRPRGVDATDHNRTCEYLQKALLLDRVMRHYYSWKHDLEEASMERVSKDAEGDEVQLRLKWKE